jgi:tRNA A37 threonylcarbamoyladenosine dehydratase
MDADFDRRFGGIGRLYGASALARFRSAHICVVGIGGVGSWAVEALARSGIGRMTLIDLDMVAESNVNRQIQALGNEFGKAKVHAMAERILAINPECRVEQIEEFVTPENLDAMLGNGFDVIVDAIDQVRTKVAMVAWCQQRAVPLIVAGGAGGQIDPTQIRLEDLSRTTQDPLLSKVRAQLRKQHNFPRDPRKKFGVTAVYSTEPLRYPAPELPESACAISEGTTGPAGLNCAGFGSGMCVTATFGLFAASAALRLVLERD